MLKSNSDDLQKVNENHERRVYRNSEEYFQMEEFDNKLSDKLAAQATIELKKLRNKDTQEKEIIEGERQ